MRACGKTVRREGFKQDLDTNRKGRGFGPFLFEHFGEVLPRTTMILWRGVSSPSSNRKKLVHFQPYLGIYRGCRKQVYTHSAKGSSNPTIFTRAIWLGQRMDKPYQASVSFIEACG